MSRTPGKNRRRGLAYRLSLTILAGTAVIFLAAFGYSYYYSRQLALHYVEDNARYLTQSVVNRIELYVQGIEKAPLFMASMLEKKALSRAELEDQIRSMLDANPDIFSSAVAFEPYVFDPSRKYYAPFYFREGRFLKRRDLGNEAYRYDQWDWYQIPREMREDGWSEPYFDEGGAGIMMSTFSAPFFQRPGGRRKFRGVVTADISLGWLVEVVSRISITPSGYAFLLSRNGVFVSHPERKLILRESIFSIAEEKGDAALRELGRRMVRGETGFMPAPDGFTPEKSWLYYEPLPSTGWSIGIVIPERELLSGIHRLTLAGAAIAAIGLSALLILVVGVSRNITRPIRELAVRAGAISKGDLDVPLPPLEARDEVGELTASFEEMRLSLKDYIRNLRETTAAKERMESELLIARNIQMSFVPKRSHRLPEGAGVEIYGTLAPAQEVGGDLYNFFLVDDDHLFFAVGDVSGKGIPAALFMAVTITLMKGIARQNTDPSDILERINGELCQENDSLMFVTVFCGILNVRTGELRYSNAGHNPPVLRSRGNNARWLQVPEGVLLGVFEDAAYRTERIHLDPGDEVILYTDGVTEAMNPEKLFYGDARLLGIVDEKKEDADPVRLVERVVESVRVFADTEPQSDDITVLAVRWTGPPASDSGASGNGGAV
ncbi:MAG: serine/threonine protein phosphatase [Deltaproteobacteria bacterium HGW-Deltaproteobacteria-19]|jgi:sigma-B regulation protein RsbU (phosphoserine phosphatase)|nr:MAG: serine/threonine protein phosphatase [Deltaproteobacteria bacterium HGW-Deltaproteobacteria-19]